MTGSRCFSEAVTVDNYAGKVDNFWKTTPNNGEKLGITKAKIVDDSTKTVDKIDVACG